MFLADKSIPDKSFKMDLMVQGAVAFSEATLQAGAEISSFEMSDEPSIHHAFKSFAQTTNNSDMMVRAGIFGEGSLPGFEVGTTTASLHVGGKQPDTQIKEWVCGRQGAGPSSERAGPPYTPL
ncbi:hypothetical protein C0Q70_13587 [Pomacea canaliculata]|uniref:Uncharacterized protein n=1 Tax=Pomacea canaliculata TaxID=400727 RepID=A0A2T7NXP6_POMCA|nr:hypothetical protein C0Q70_13587 [Pomacea canaliculata]